MAVVNLSMMALQVKAMTEAGTAESEAISKVIEDAGISEEQAQEMNIAAEVTALVNRDTEAEAAEAEAQLQEQASGFRSEILKNREAVAQENEATLQEETPDAP